MPTAVVALEVSPSTDSSDSSVMSSRPPSGPAESTPPTQESAPEFETGAAGVDLRFYEHWTPRERMRILIIGACATLLVPITDTFYLPSLTVVESDLQTTATLVSATVSMFTLVVGVLPLLWGPLADYWGRKKTLIVSLTVYAATSVACIFVPDIWTMLVLRFFQALGCASAVPVGSGMLADVIPPSERGSAFGIFGVPTLVGPILGPLLGGAIANAFGWRAGFVLLAILAVLQIGAMLFFVPETLWYAVQQRHRKELLAAEVAAAAGGVPVPTEATGAPRAGSAPAHRPIVAVEARDLMVSSLGDITPATKPASRDADSGLPGTAQTNDSLLTADTGVTVASADTLDMAPAAPGGRPTIAGAPSAASAGRLGPDGFADIPAPKMLPPWLPLAFLKEPKTAYLAWASGLAISSLYLTVIVYPVLLAEHYGLNELMVGVCFVPPGTVALFGAIIGGVHAAHWYKQYPGLVDSQIASAMIGTVVLIPGMLLYGWTDKTHLAAPIISSSIIGFGIAWMMTGQFAYITTARPNAVGSLSACLTFAQFVLSAVAILAGGTLSTVVGVGPLFTFMAGLLIVTCAPGIWYFRRRLRNYRKVAPEPFTAAEAGSSKDDSASHPHAT